MLCRSHNLPRFSKGRLELPSAFATIDVPDDSTRDGAILIGREVAAKANIGSPMLCRSHNLPKFSKGRLELPSAFAAIDVPDDSTRNGAILIGREVAAKPVQADLAEYLALGKISKSVNRES